MVYKLENQIKLTNNLRLQSRDISTTPEFPVRGFISFSQRRHCEETQIRIQLIKQLSERESGIEEPGNCIENLLRDYATKSEPEQPLCVFLSSTGKGH